MSDSSGYIVDENGIDYKAIKEIKEVKRARVKTYLDYVPTGKNMWKEVPHLNVACDIALPCATQNELDGASAEIPHQKRCKSCSRGCEYAFYPGSSSGFP